MKLKSIVSISLAATAAAVISSCASSPVGGGSALKTYQAYDRPTQLPSNPDKVRVKVSLSKQRTYVMEGSDILLVMPVSIGSPGAPTPSGNFTIFKKDATHRAKTHGYAYSGHNAKKTMLRNRPAGWSFKGTPMPYWCEFKPGYGFHTGWVKHHPCTDRCIRMHENLAPKFFRLVQVGTPVSIAYSQPEDAAHENIPLPPDAGPLPDYPMSLYIGDGYFKQHKIPRYD